MLRKRSTAVWLTLFAAIVSPVSLLAAKPPADGGAAVLSDVMDCRAISEADKRLACYDKAVGAFADAERNGDVVVADRAKIRETKRSLFGFVSKSLPIFGEHDKEDMPAEIDAKITSLRDMGYGKWDFVLDNGMHWRQTDTTDITPHVGDDVTIKRAAMGSYFLKVHQQRIVRAIRVG